MKILVTGVYGFLGFNLANFLAEKHNVFGLYHKNKRGNLSKNITVFNDITQIEIEPDVVIMCHAAVVSGTTVLSEKELETGNVSFTQTLLNYFPKAKIIYISTVAVYGNTEQLITESTSENPQSAYAVSKLKAEQLLLKNATSIIIRLSSLYGNGMKENTLIPNYCNQALENNCIEVWGNGSRKQNYIHVADVVELIEKIIDKKDIKEALLLGVSTKEYTNLEVAQIISELTNAKIKFIKEDNSKSIIYNNDITRKSLNWEPKIELEEGIKKYLEWKQKQF